MWLKPEKDKAIICPSDKVKRPDLLSKCRKAFEDNGCATCAQGDGFCGPSNGCMCNYPGGFVC